MVNKDKTTLFFSKNTVEGIKDTIKLSLRVSAILHYDKYLGLTSFVEQNKRTCFTQVTERIWSRIQVWKEKLLSQADKEVMIKAII